ncbi:peptidoglycan binding domain-containing protein, partial [Kitasatospora sp. NPDC059571]|uniref:peptidoglycan binding domain-containing protein n=1 Tax=Kitasatospora sp. NPDC059571 TaxID=3346871 RepID=UPI0036AD6A7D
AEPAPKRRGKARKLAGYAVGGLLFAGAAAYGTGLMLNQADIPKGTTVLGTDIGGDSRDQAISALDASVAKTGKAPIKLKVGGQALALDPATAGLAFDTTATVDALTKHSYNPVEVIGALAGGTKAVEPTVTVDSAKLKAALDGLAAKSGQGLTEGHVRFTEAGGTEVVPGKAGQALDSASAAAQVEQAYRDRAAGKPDTEVSLPLTAAKPKVGEDALQAAAADLGKQVLAGRITLRAGAKSWDFGKLTAAKALTLAPDASGKIVLTWDLDKLDTALGGIFDKSKTRKNGTLAPITPQDVADGIAAVVGKTGKDRVFVFPA